MHRSTLVLALTTACAALVRPAGAQTARDRGRPVIVVSSIGGKCLNAEGNATTSGTRVIGYPCSGAGNEQFTFNHNGTITQRGKCLDVKGGLGRDGGEIVLWDCNGGPNQQWQFSNGRIVGMHGKCLDLKGGSWANVPLLNQPTILFGCNGQDNQTWRWAVSVPRSNVRDATLLTPGAIGSMRPIPNVVAAGGANVVAPGGANVIAPGGAN